MFYHKTLLIFPIIILLILALVSAWIARIVELPLQQQKKAVQDYYVSNFTTTRSDELGKLQTKLTASYLTHHVDNDIVSVKNPFYSQYQNGKHTFTIESQTAQKSTDDNHIAFQGSVKVLQPKTQTSSAMEFMTEFLDVFVKEGIAKTSSPVTIKIYPETVITGNGFSYDKNNKILVLKNRVKVHYVRSTTNFLERKIAK